MIEIPEHRKRLLGVPYHPRQFALAFLSPSEKAQVDEFGTYLNFLLQNAGLTTPGEARFIRCIQGREVPVHEHELVWLKLLHLNSYEVLQFLLNEARSVSVPLQNATLLEFPDLWKRLLERFGGGYIARGIHFYGLALSLMSSTQLYEFAHALQILRGRFPAIRFTTIYLIHSLAGAAGDVRSQHWVREQGEAGGSSSGDYFSNYLGYGDPFGDRHRRSNKDAATAAVAGYHLLHKDDGTQEAGIDTKDLTDFEREQLKYDGGAGSHYWDAD